MSLSGKMLDSELLTVTATVAEETIKETTGKR